MSNHKAKQNIYINMEQKRFLDDGCEYEVPDDYSDKKVSMKENNRDHPHYLEPIDLSLQKADDLNLNKTVLNTKNVKKKKSNKCMFFRHHLICKAIIAILLIVILIGLIISIVYYYRSIAKMIIIFKKFKLIYNFL